MKTTVLVVEDDLEISELVGEYFALENIQAIAAPTGKAGIHLATERHPDAIILDLMLPDIDGYEVARILSSQRATADIPIIILSCMCLPADRQKGFANGAQFFMNKPFLPDDLLATVRAALELKASLKTRTEGVIEAGGEINESLKSIGQMNAALLARTTLPEGEVLEMRHAMETLDGWARQWKAEHNGDGGMRIDYRLDPAAAPLNGSGALAADVEWKLTEPTPGMLQHVFFKGPQTGGTAGGGLIGWGAATFLSKPIAPITIPARWLEILAQTGAPYFEKDSKAPFVRLAHQPRGAQAAAAGGAVPVVEIGAVAQQRQREESLAGKRK